MKTSIPISRTLDWRRLSLWCLSSLFVVLCWYIMPTHREFAAPTLIDGWQAASKQPQGQWVDMVVRPGDSFHGLFQRYHIPTQVVPLFEQGVHFKTAALHMMPGQRILCLLDAQRHLLSLSMTMGRTRLILERHGAVYQERVEPLAVQSSDHVHAMTIRTSLFQQGLSQGISPQELMDVAHVLRDSGWSARRLRPGDHIAFITRVVAPAGGRPTRHILAVRWRTQRHGTHQVIRFEKQGRVGYYHHDGRSILPYFLRTPVHYRRISSPFNLHRFHPLLRRIRPHKGVDLAAAYGRPIWATAEGVVSFVGRVRGYGRVVKIRHAHDMETRYAHMSRYAKHLHPGQHVHAHQVIGYVGMSGLATGPHCHYELRIHSRPINPLKGFGLSQGLLKGQDALLFQQAWQALQPAWSSLEAARGA